MFRVAMGSCLQETDFYLQDDLFKALFETFKIMNYTKDSHWTSGCPSTVNILVAGRGDTKIMGKV